MLLADIISISNKHPQKWVIFLGDQNKKSLKIINGSSETVKTKTQWQKGQTMAHKKLHTKLKIGQQTRTPIKSWGGNLGAPEGKAVGDIL